MVRVDSSLHAEIAAAATHERKSLNQWISDALNQVVHSHESQV
ncbi:MAG: toxin-antitoxin system HicB family antitoxin [Desulfobacula sp.]